MPKVNSFATDFPCGRDTLPWVFVIMAKQRMGLVIPSEPYFFDNTYKKPEDVTRIEFDIIQTTYAQDKEAKPKVMSLRQFAYSQSQITPVKSMDILKTLMDALHTKETGAEAIFILLRIRKNEPGK